MLGPQCGFCIAPPWALFLILHCSLVSLQTIHCFPLHPSLPRSFMVPIFSQHEHA
ncbi:MAG: hypothetical protein BYD32DRAFT_408444, partial [Podila humilis]